MVFALIGLGLMVGVPLLMLWIERRRKAAAPAAEPRKIE
jgi:hypothetical protein